VIQLLREPQLELEEAIWSVILWVCEPFDEEYSLRELFAEITAVLGDGRGVVLGLPPEEAYEDSVSGTLLWGSTGYGIYFERSLGYVEFFGASQTSERELLDALTPHCTWARASEGDFA
jgi:hypothetical protein